MKIAFYDSGVGGLTIFNDAFKSIKADYIYFADNLNTPYGIKSKNEVKKIVMSNIEKIITMGVDILVIACNTATSVAIDVAREKFKNKCIIGTEPAIKVASDKSTNDKKILLCATTLTIKEEKIKKLVDNLNLNDKIEFLRLNELVAFAENLDFNSNFVEEYLKDKFLKFNLAEYEYLVLGCTHFPLFNGVLRNILPKNINIVDSTQGVVNNIKNTILKLNLKEDESSNVELILTKNEKEYICKFTTITGIKEVNVKVI